MTLEQLQERLQLAVHEQDKSNYAEAEKLCNEVLRCYDEQSSDTQQTTDWRLLRAKTIRAYGASVWKRGDFESSLTLFEEALEFFQSIPDATGVVDVTGNIGNVYHSLGSYQKALEYLEKALALHKELGQKSGVANVTGNIGNSYHTLGSYDKALEYYERAVVLHSELGEKLGVARVTGNIGIVHYFLGAYDKALECFVQSFTLHTELGDKSGAARLMGQIGAGYYALGSYDKSLEHFSQALVLHSELGEKSGIASVTANIGTLYQSIGSHNEALEYLAKAVALNNEIGQKSGAALAMANLGIVYKDLGSYEQALECYGQALALHTELGAKSGIATVMGNIGNIHRRIGSYDKALESFSQAITLHTELGEKSGVAGITGSLGNLFSTKEFYGYDFAKAEDYFLKAISMAEELGLKLNLYLNHQSLAQLYENEEQWKESHDHFKKYHEIEKEVQSEEVKNQAERLGFERKTAEREKQIAIERTRFQERESILNNILPEGITDRLIMGENPIADHFDSVSIMFMDIVDFTKLSTKISAQQLVHLLNAIFTCADTVMREFGLEKIKTIGDCYMAVAGAPTKQDDHALRAAHASLKLLEEMKNLVVTFPENYGDRSWIANIPEIDVRIGLHCGPVAAGVVGENKFLYDLWGDAVNTASRMESHGEPGKIHVSEDFKHAVETLHATSLHAETLHAEALHVETLHATSLHATSLRFVPRGAMEIKGKGLMKTYFMENV